MRPITLCLAYYENAAMLVEQIGALCALPNAYWPHLTLIVVDDGSPTAPARLPDLRLPFEARVYRMRKDIPWNQDACRNLAVAEARTEWVLLTDMDHVPTEALLRRAIEGDLEPRKAYTFARVSAPDLAPYKPHPNSWLMTRKLYFRAGGYDERFGGVYGTDGMFKRRVGEVAKAVVALPEALIRYPREVIPDASTTTLTRKGPENEAARDRVKAAIKASGRPEPVRGLTAWDRVA